MKIDLREEELYRLRAKCPPADSLRRKLAPCGGNGPEVTLTKEQMMEVWKVVERARQRARRHQRSPRGKASGRDHRVPSGTLRGD